MFAGAKHTRLLCQSLIYAKEVLLYLTQINDLAKEY